METNEQLFEMFNNFLTNKENEMKTIKSFSQKGWDVELNETSDNQFCVVLKRDESTLDTSTKVRDYNVASHVFDVWLNDLTSRVIKGV
jgi:hypothetical protein